MYMKIFEITISDKDIALANILHINFIKRTKHDYLLLLFTISSLFIGCHKPIPFFLGLLNYYLTHKGCAHP